MKFNKSDLLSAHLAEYNCLRGEILQILKWKDNLIIISLTITGAVLSFSVPLFYNASAGNAVETGKLALYLLTPLSAIETALWLESKYRTSRLSDYISNCISPEVKNLFPVSYQNNEVEISIKVLDWEKVQSRLLYRKSQKWLMAGAHIMVFGGSGIAGQILLLGLPSCRFEKLFQWETIWYSLNIILIIFIFWVFISQICKAYK